VDYVGIDKSTGRRRKEMVRKLAVLLMTLVGCTYAASPAVAAPNADHASCEAILTSPDAHVQIRDDVSREVAAEDFPPGDLYSDAARATGTTEQECEAGLGGD
jgi:hypothetical protein